MKEFKNGMKCEKMVDDGCYSIGYVDGVSCQWFGNTELTEGDYFMNSPEGQTFGVNCQDEFIMKEGVWRENIEEEIPEIVPCNCGSGEPRMSCSAPFGWEFCG